MDEEFDDNVPINLPAPPGMGVLPIAPNMDGEETASSSGRGLHSLQNSVSVVCERKWKRNSVKENSVSVCFC